jgi:hypothetical protein
MSIYLAGYILIRKLYEVRTGGKLMDFWPKKDFFTVDLFF